MASTAGNAAQHAEQTSAACAGRAPLGINADPVDGACRAITKLEAIEIANIAATASAAISRGHAGRPAAVIPVVAPVHRICGQLGEQAADECRKCLMRQAPAPTAHLLGNRPQIHTNQPLGTTGPVDKHR